MDTQRLDERTMHAQIDYVIGGLMETYRICRQTAAHCIDEGGDLATIDRLRAFDDCAEINLTLANFLLRDSEHARLVAATCLEITTACAESMREIEHRDGQLRAAYAVCLKTRHICLRLLGKKEAEAEDGRDEAIRDSFPASDPPPPPTSI